MKRLVNLIENRIRMVDQFGYVDQRYDQGFIDGLYWVLEELEMGEEE